jgi:hypothetical protein
MIKNKCNMDPTSFSMPVIDMVPRLGCHFNLNMMELHSCQIAYQVLPHTCVFFGIAAETLLQLPPSRIPRGYREGHGFGYLLAKVMLDLFETARKLGAPQDFRRFNLYKDPSVPDRQQWEFECHNVNSFCLHAFAAFDGSANEKQRAEQYKVISRTICDLTEGVGTLTASHSMNQKACLGLLPAWCRDHAIIEPSSRVIQFFNTEYEMKKKLNKLELDRFFKTIAR